MHAGIRGTFVPQQLDGWERTMNSILYYDGALFLTLIKDLDMFR